MEYRGSWWSVWKESRMEMSRGALWGRGSCSQEDVFHQEPGDRHIVLLLTFNSGHEAGRTSPSSQRVPAEHAHPDTPPQV